MGAELEYVGGGLYVVGWPACDHYEPDDALARLKVASGLYRYKAQAEDADPEARPTKSGKGGR
jgi:hypothetical protein